MIKKKKTNNIQQRQQEYSVIAQNMVRMSHLSLEEAEGAVCKAAMLVNIAYALSDTQDSLLREADDLLRLCYQSATRDSRMRFKRIRKNIDAVLYPLKEEAKFWNSTQRGADDTQKKSDAETKAFIEGLSDLYYDVVRMLFDRMATKKDVIHLIHLIRTIPNHNHYFPKLDKGRYIIS